jgi:hypothetical protein
MTLNYVKFWSQMQGHSKKEKNANKKQKQYIQTHAILGFLEYCIVQLHCTITFAYRMHLVRILHFYKRHEMLKKGFVFNFGRKAI